MSNIEIGCICVAVFCVCTVLCGAGLLVQQIYHLQDLFIAHGKPFEVSEEDYYKIKHGSIDKERLFGDKVAFGECVFAVRVLRQKGKYMCFWKHAKESV